MKGKPPTTKCKKKASLKNYQRGFTNLNPHN